LKRMQKVGMALLIFKFALMCPLALSRPCAKDQLMKVIPKPRYI
jgi:hypothetical protein